VEEVEGRSGPGGVTRTVSGAVPGTVTGTVPGTVPDTVSVPVSAIAAGLLLLLSSCALGGGGITPVRTPFNRGVYHQSAGRIDAAIHEYRLALEEDPTDVRARFNLASALEDAAGRVEDPGERRAELLAEAEGEYRRILEQVPDHLRASVNLASLMARTGREAEARERLLATKRRNPKSVLPRSALAALDVRGGRLEEAEKELRDALRIDPADVPVLHLLGDVQGARGQTEQAGVTYRRALTAHPDDLGVLRALSELEVRGGRPLEARVYLERLLLVDPDDAPAHLLLSRVFEETDDLEGAVFHLWRARDLGAEGAASARSRLSRLYLRLLEDVEAGERPGS